MKIASYQYNAECIPYVGTVEILVVASEKGKIIFKLLEFPPVLRPRKSPLAVFANNSVFVAHPSALYAEFGDVYPLVKSAVDNNLAFEKCK